MNTDSVVRSSIHPRDVEDGAPVRLASVMPLIKCPLIEHKLGNQGVRFSG